MYSMKKKRGTFASRAHSFKENFLDALKNSPSSSSTPGRKHKPAKTFIQLAKKTGSTDNLTGHLGTARSTDCLVKEVQLALKYFQDVVSKNTIEMLPGCATVVLETVLAIQAFAGSIEDPMDPEVTKALESAFRSVSHLTNWADSVIVSGEVDSTESVLENIIEPVRKSVIIVVNLLSYRIGNKNLTRGNSLPDITSESQDQDSSIGLSLSSDSILDLSPVKPPLLPKISLYASDSAPPLPPKNHLKPRLDRTLEDLISRSYSFHQGDSLNSSYYGLAGFQPRYGYPAANKSLPTPDGLETTLLDQSFDFMDYADSPYSLSKESVNNISFEDVDSSSYKPSLNVSSRSWSSKERSNASSPSLESFSSHLSDTVDREYPPAIPRKYRETSLRKNGQSLSHYPPSAEQSRNTRNNARRKLSEYDNVFNPDKTLDMLTRLSLDENTNQKSPVKSTRSDLAYPNHYELRGPTTTWSKIAESRHTYQDRPPPLPPKKRNVMSYMEMFGKSILPSGEDIMQGFFQTHDLLHNVWQHNFHEYSEYAPTGLLNFPLMDNAHRESKKSFLPSSSGNDYVNHNMCPDVPPALPPKRSRSRPGSFRSSASAEERTIPIIREDPGLRMSQVSDNSLSSNSSSEIPKLAEITKLTRLSVAIPIERVKESTKKQDSTGEGPDSSVLDSNEIKEYLVYGSSQDKAGVGGTSELRGGTVDALVVLATQTIKNDFLYQEAFLTTYRTFISTQALVDKLVYRYRYFGEKSNSAERTDSTFRRSSRAAFSLLVRVVDGLAEVDFQDKVLLEKLTEFITSLIENGNLGLARALRSQFILKYEERRTRLLPEFDLAAMNSINRRCTLLNFKSSELAEQMTLLDSNLFMRIDSAELLNWVQEQAEEKSPNLTKFTEHFNNMSYWTRTLILNQPDAKERERYVMKFIKMMKWLRKMNNFNSYLALLSALDSAPIRRLEWQKNITEGLKEYCSLIDSSSSFRAYRTALAESTPPCIPYIGLVLQDLTFVHIGNPDTTADTKINFAKRWQQFNILDNLRRFKKVQYHISRHEEIIQFFGEFDDFLTEDEMWSISETIKPRGQNNKGK